MESMELMELQYINLIKHILKNGISKDDRTGIGTLSIFSYNMTFNLRESFPLLTTKKVYWKGVVEELLWFISGSTDSNVLKEKGVRIWEGNSSREFLDSQGLSHYDQGDIGAGYGFQWRHFGAKYTNMYDSYEGQGVDQLKDVIYKIKNTPDDRRIIMSAWNPTDLDKMALPPCHIFVQFWVDSNKKELHSQMYQRSCDVGLGVPFNIASYALLTCIIAKLCDLTPGDFHYCMGDTHIYKNHIDAIKLQITRDPYDFPKINIKDITDIDNIKFDDIELIDYKYYENIKMNMAV
jgi:thymidylate synthase